MSVSVHRIRPDPRLSVEETAFLRERAFPLWCDEGAFANQEVAQAKALFRRGKAQLRLGNTEAAERDLEAAQKLTPHDAAVTRELQVI